MRSLHVAASQSRKARTAGLVPRFSEASHAHERAMAGGGQGKIVLTVA